MQNIEKSYVYKATPENLKVFKDHPRKLMSDDKKFILVYSEEHLQEIYDYSDWLLERLRFDQYSQNDKDYDDLLRELGIYKPFDFESYSNIYNQIDETKDIIITFNNSKSAFGTILCNQQELNKGKAKVTLVFLEKREGVFSKSVKDVKPLGYVTFERKGNHHEGK